MTTTTNTTIAQDEIISDDEVAILNAARTLAAELVARTRKLSWDPRIDSRTLGSDTPDAFDLGLLVAHFEEIGTAVFDALNVTRSYCHVPLTDDQVHNRPPEAL